MYFMHPHMYLFYINLKHFIYKYVAYRVYFIVINIFYIYTVYIFYACYTPF